MYDPNNLYEAETQKDNRDNKEEYKDERPLDKTYKEETAAEYAPNPGLGIGGTVEETGEEDVEREEEKDTAGKGIGTLGIALAIVSLFFLPIVFSIAGIIFGAIAVKQDQKGIGYTAIGIAAFSIIMSFFFAPFVI